MLSRGVNIKMVQKILGHASMATTMIYTEGLIGDLYDEMSKMME